MPDTKKNLKDAALKLFLKKGYAKTTIGEIESAAGLAPRAGSFYRHFQSKQELLIEIAKTQIAERPSEFDFSQINSLGNTRAELILIAQIYEKASHRQKGYLPLIEEIRRTRFGRKFEQKANQEMLHVLMTWISLKPAAKSLNDKQLASLAMAVFGGWLFYLTKLQQGVTLDEIERDSLLNDWADVWSDYLDTA
jgi:AcrR family transcriptional regulator